MLHNHKTRIQSRQICASLEADHELILLYWDIGRVIFVKHQVPGSGKTMVECLSADLPAEFPGAKGFSTNNLWLMR